MPNRNIIRYDFADSFYHVYGRGAAGRTIFKDNQDKQAFLGMLQRYLSKKPVKTPRRTLYPNYYGQVELAAFCIMGTHFHLLFWQAEPGLMAKLMQSLLSSYTVYYNKKYQTRGALLESRYRARQINEDNYLLHLTRYIHLNPPDFRDYDYSSLPYYVAGLREDWVRPDRVIDMYDLTPAAYWDLLADYEEKKDEIEQIKYDFADGGDSIEKVPF
jgi:putative transposase